MTKKPGNQVGKFREAARKLGCDGSEERFDTALKTIGKGKLKRPDPDPMPTDDPEALVEWGKRNIQGQDNET